MRVDSNELQKVIVAVPPLDQQRRFISAIDALAEHTERLADVFDRKVAALDRLKNCLLQQAFTGGLTEKSRDEQGAKDL